MAGNTNIHHLAQEVFPPAEDAAIAKAAEESKEEAAEKLQRLKDFYAQKGWVLAPLALDYLGQFKPVGKKRKDGITEDILHELDPLVMLKGHLEGGLLPKHDVVTFYLENGQKILIPPAFQSIEHVFIAVAIHDTDEDYPEASADHFIQFMLKGIDRLGIPDEEKNRLIFSLQFDIASMEALTFGRKTFDKGSRVITIPTHDGDLNQYLQAVENHWPAVLAKGLDRLGGLVTRFNPVSEKQPFTIEKQQAYLKDTYRNFMHAQPLENGMDRFPELRDSIDIINAKINVAYRCLSAIIENHPEVIKNIGGKLNFKPETARIEIHRYLVKATADLHCLDDDTLPLVRMVDGFMREAEKHPSLLNLVRQMDRQITASIDAVRNPKNNISATAHTLDTQR